MKTASLLLCLLLATLVPTTATAQTSAFTYQGQLKFNGTPANGVYDFMFRLMNDPVDGTSAPVIPISLAVTVSNGLFTTGMDFGAENLGGANLWLEVNVRTNGSGSFTALSPRQLLTSAPYAVRTISASNLLGTLPANQISGTILNSSMPASPIFSGTATASNFSGNGAELTNVNATTLEGLNSSHFWRTTGNAETTTGTHFLGTTDNQPLELRVNSQRGLRLEPGGSNSVNVIGGWAGNSVTPGVVAATVSGGGAPNWVFSLYRNRVEADFGTVSGGGDNNIASTSIFATIAGGGNNHIGTNSQSTTIGGGANNHIAANSPWANIAGGVLNDVSKNSACSVIGGGFDNNIAASQAAIAGGRFNAIGIGSDSSCISGGEENSVGGNSGYSTIAGGYSNSIGTNWGANAISGGYNNGIADYSSQANIAGGGNNDIGTNCNFGVIGGGFDNTIVDSSAYATIPGGRQNTATNSAFAAGNQAKANHTGAFVWGDATDTDIASTNANSVTMRASGGYRLFTDSEATAGVSLAAGSGSWTSMSDRNLKENFAPVDAQAVLAKVAALPMSTWNYKSQDASIQHIGPMAQDFKAAFDVGEGETGISTVDADGVALAAIQGLNQKLEAARAENATLAARLEKLEALVRNLCTAR